MRYIKYLSACVFMSIFLLQSTPYVFAVKPVPPGDGSHGQADLLPEKVQAPDVFEWITTKASIEDLEFKRVGRLSFSIGTVSFQDESGKPVITNVDLPHIPYITHIHRVGQIVTIEYRSDAPMIARTPGEGFIRKYGLIIAIIAGVIISVTRLIRVFKYN